MILFWLICAGLVAIALAFLLPTLLQGGATPADSGDEEANLEVYRDQLSELKSDLANGIVSPEQYQQDRDEIERRLLEDVPSVKVEAAIPTLEVWLKPVAWSLIALGVLSFILPRFGLQHWLIKAIPGTQPTLGVALLILGALVLIARSNWLATRSLVAGSLISFGIISFILPRLGVQDGLIKAIPGTQPALGVISFTLGAFILVSRSNRIATRALALALPVMAVAFYLTVGNLHAFDPATAASPPGGQMTQQGIEANVAALAQRLEQNPNDADGWAMLGRSYINLEKYSEASNAYAKADNLKKNDPDLLVEYAFALAMANGRQLQGKPTELIKQALQIAPENPRVLQLAGSVEFEAKNYKQAIVHWQKLLAKSAGNPELEQSISKRIDEAKKLDVTPAK
ncbi:MAG TPA: c-type cytochrome biogenesis protein CcmI [Pyrinomonadaceae bacterium]|jgi:cytochrome c-type biogenesis protein CcmI|nr:c-type cytochrome biogenesis protein CcmI [Pyrinomonadaceae bacterium]